MPRLIQKILVVEDRKVSAEFLRLALESQGYKVYWVPTGTEVLSFCKDYKIDLFIFDLKLPNLSGHELCKRVRADIKLRHLPIIILTTDLSTKIQSLNQGADACVVNDRMESRSFKELLATIRAIERRMELDAGTIQKGDLRLEPKKRSVYHNESLTAELSLEQFAFFQTLVENGPRPVSRQQLYRIVLQAPDPSPESKALEMLARRTKLKLGKIGQRIKNSKHLGWFYLEPNPS